MPPRSPRPRGKPAGEPRLPGKRRPRATPGRGRTARSSAAARQAGARRHALKGARGTGAAAIVRDRKAATRRRAAVGARRMRIAPPTPSRAAKLFELLARAYPDAHTALHHENPLQLLVATILSAQCTDERVNLVTPALFARFPDAAALAGADRAELEGLIRSTGFYRNKAKAIQSCCADLVAHHGGQVPQTLEALTALKGVGRKTANVVLGNAFGIPGLVVDTHVQRLALRLGLTRETDPVKIEFALMPIVPRETWSRFSHWLILHGRSVCAARKPRCSACTLAPHCPRIGVTASS